MSSLYLTTREAAQRLNISKRFLENARRGGEGPRFIAMGSAIRYAVADLDSWIAARTHASIATRQEG